MWYSALWGLHPRCRSLARLYRFVDPAEERAFQESNEPLHTWNVQAHYVGALAQMLLHCGFFVAGDDSASLAFWPHLLVGLLAASLAFSSACCQRVRGKLQLFHFLFCTIRILCWFGIAGPQADGWSTHTFRWWVPLPSHILLTEPDGPKVLDREFSALLLELYAGLSVSFAYASLAPIWLHLMVFGLNPFSIVGHLLLMLCLIIISFTTHGLPKPVACATSAGAVFATVIFLALSLALERCLRTKALRELQLLQQLTVSQAADTVLNHSLKNTMADASGQIEAYCGGHAPATVLQDAAACLRRGMRACKERHVYLQLVAGEYRPVQNAVDLRAFGEQLLAGRKAIGRFLDLTVCMDSTLCSLILENAISNAFKHGCPGSQSVELSMEEVWSDGSHHIKFSVVNAADPCAPPLSEEFVAQLFQGQPQHGDTTPALSDGIGFSHAVMAARLANISLDLQQCGDVVAFTALMEAKGSSTPSLIIDMPTTPKKPTGQDFPRGLRFFVLDDSAVARSLLKALLTTGCDPGAVSCFGAEGGDVDCFVSQAVLGADVVIIDQHLEYGTQSFLGTDIVEQLLALRFPGFICVRSADDAAEDKLRYVTSGAHFCVGKDIGGADMIAQLKEAYILFSHRPETAPPTPDRLGPPAELISPSYSAADSSSSHPFALPNS